MSTTWKSLAVGFGAGILSMALYFQLGLRAPGAILWGISLGYIGYQYYEARKGN
ncbi:MAG TPA: hypothetical protein VF910_00885 [Candidatus Bathyarchaeia archaeon]